MDNRYQLLKRQLKSNMNKAEVIQEVITKQMQNYYDYHYISLALNYVMFRDTAKQQKQFQEVGQLIQQISTTAQSIFNQQTSEVKAYEVMRNQMNQTKLELKNQLKVLTAYSDFLKLVEYKKNRMEWSDQVLPNDEQLVKTLLEYIYSVNQHTVIKDKIRMILAQLPVRLTRSKILSLVDDTVDQYKGSSKQALQDFMVMFMETLSPQQVVGYGTIYIPVLKEAEAIQSQLIEGCDLQQISSQLIEVAGILSDLINFYLIVSDVLDNMLGILITRQYLNNGYESEKKVEQLFANIAQTEDEVVIAEKLAAFEGMLEVTLDDLNQYQTLVSDIMTQTEVINPVNNDHDIVKDFELLEKMLSNSFFPDTIEVQEELANYGDLANAKVKLSAFVEVLLKTSSRLEKQALMGNMWLMLAIPFKTPQELSDYLYQSLSTITTPSEKVAFWEIFKQIRDDQIKSI